MFSRLQTLPGVKQVIKARFNRGFEGDWAGSFRGVFSTFEQASLSAPGTKPLGYNHDAASEMYAERLREVVASDYPVMFWLGKLMAGGARNLFDLGGHVGLACHAYQRYLDFPDDFSWTVYDVPAVRATGERLAGELSSRISPRFTGDTADGAGVDVLLSAGALQYIDEPRFDAYLASLKRLPRNILLSKIPLGHNPEFVTLQNIGTAYCPYRIFNDHEFVAGLKRLGYEVRDRWLNAEGCNMALNPELSVPNYTGMLLQLPIASTS